MQHPPGPRGRKALGFFGAGSVGGMLTFFEETARRYGPISSFRLLHKRIYLVDDAELVQELLVTRQHEFIRDTGATLGRELVGDGLLTREEPLHRERRRILQPAFHRDQIASYAAAMTDECEQLSREWENKETLDIRMEMRRLTLAIVGATLFGTDFRDSAEQIASVLQRVARKGRWLAPAITFIEPLVLAYRRLIPHGRSLFFPREREELQRIVAPIIAQRRDTGKRDVLSLILNQRLEGDAPLSDEDVVNEAVTFVLAGHETTAVALTWTWYLLAQHPQVTARLHAELDDVLGGRTPQLDDVPRLPYTANVFKEAMRLYPPALLFARRPKKDVEFGGYRIARGQSIFVSPYITQRNPRYFERPESFEPERWEHINIPKFAYFPFGGGAKMCIGEPFARMEGLLALATLASRWTLQRDNKEPVGIGNGAVLNPDQAIIMRLEARQQKASELVLRAVQDC
jgi:cytochrome P450